MEELWVNFIILLFGKEFYINQLFSQEVFTMWLKMLPNLLCRERISYNILNAFSSLSRQNNSIFLSELEMKSNDIIGEL